MRTGHNQAPVRILKDATPLQNSSKLLEILMNPRSHTFKIAVALVLLLAGLLTACGATPPAKPEPRPEPEKVEVAVVPPPTPHTPATPTPPPAIIAPDDGCVNCHTNPEQLIATAKEEEVVESLNEGEG
ncbi:MAG: hypothetical protein D6768_04820 [Chloroflexi bacterium]|nr:MAG: hypothetical protein D6768_04820 [Chloroflexota bacterium]